MAQTLVLGDFVAGEKPNALQYQFQNADGTPIDLTGYTVRFTYRERDGVPTTVSASLLDAVNGQVGYTWTGSEFSTPGAYQAEFWVGNNAQRYASWLITWTVRAPVGATPSI